MKFPEEFEKLGIDPIKGVMIYGPPGTGKTMIAKAIAHESEANFISIKGPELFNKWLGESEKAIRKIFQKARQTAPCILFFDEIDAVATKRGSDEDNGTSSRIVNQLLTELDGLTSLKGVVFVAATNRIQAVDTALLRPGRIDKIILTTLPEKKERTLILKKITEHIKLDPEVKIEKLADKTDDFSNAELVAVIREAGLTSLERNNMKATTIKNQDIEAALKKYLESKNIGAEKEDHSYVR